MKKIRFAVVAFALCGLFGCATTDQVIVDDDDDDGEVTQAPPTAQVEVVPVSPGPTHVWVGGHWGWRRGAYVWRPGRCVVVRQGYAYVPGYWHHHQRGHYVWVRPRWRR